jgi:predicted molibdopterin-dependent oxidoreductase YjgC
MESMRVTHHPILGELTQDEPVTVTVDGKPFKALRGEVIAAVLMANGIMVHRHTTKTHKPRGVYCGIGQCTDCVMTVNGKPNVRTCITPVEEGMEILTQDGVGKPVRHD